MPDQPHVLSIEDAVAAFVHDGDSVALEGFTHLIPFAAGQEIIRQGRRDLTLVRMTPDIIYDQMVGAGCARKVKFSWGGNPGVGSLHRFRDAVERQWPRPIEIEEHAHAGMAAAYAAGAARIPFGLCRGYFGLCRGYLGTDLMSVNPNIRLVTCPFTGETIPAVPAINPDVAIVHAQKADRQGNILISGIVGVQKEAVLASRHAIVTVEEIVDDLGDTMNRMVLPHWIVSAVCLVPRGAHPSYAHGYYPRDNAAYLAWDAIAADRGRFVDWLRETISPDAAAALEMA